MNSMQKVYKIEQVAKKSRLSPWTIRKYIRELKLDTVMYSPGKMQLNEKAIDRIMEHAKHKAKNTRQVRADNMRKIRFVPPKGVPRSEWCPPPDVA